MLFQCALSACSVRISHSVGRNEQSNNTAENPNVCVVKCLKVYEHRTSALRPLDPSKLNKPLLSYICPYEPISSASLSRWLKDIISLAGIDTSTFKAHSVRGVSALAAHERGVSLQDILDLADW